MNDFYVPVVPKDKVTHIVISVHHVAKQARLSAYPAEVSENGIATLHITEGAYATLEPMARLSRKRMQTLVDICKTQIREKIGMAYDTAMKLGLTIA